MKITENDFNETIEDALNTVMDGTRLPNSDYLANVTEPLSDDYVESHNDELTQKYAGAIKVYGYESFGDLYLATKADFASDESGMEFRAKEAEKSASKNKDVSKLRLVQRTVMRRGKPTTLSFYEDPNKGEKKTEADNPPKQQDGEQEADYTGFYTAGENFGKPDQARLNSLLPPEDWYTVGSTKGNMYDCLYFVNGTEFTSVAGVKRVGNLLTLAFVSTKDKKSYQLGLYRSLKKLISLIQSGNYVGKDLGFTYKPHPDEEDLCKILFDYLDIKERNKTYEQKDLSKSLGERVWTKF